MGIIWYQEERYLVPTKFFSHYAPHSTAYLHHHVMNSLLEEENENCSFMFIWILNFPSHWSSFNNIPSAKLELSYM